MWSHLGNRSLNLTTLSTRRSIELEGELFVWTYRRLLGMGSLLHGNKILLT